VSVVVCFLARTGLAIGTDSRVTSRFGKHGETQEDAYPKLVTFGQLPIACAMVGAGSFQGRDFRSLVREAANQYDGTGSVRSVAERFAEVAGAVARKGRRKGREMEVWIGGFSPDEHFGELFGVQLPSGKVECLRRPGEQTFRWMGANEAINTLFWGADRAVLKSILDQHDIDAAAAEKIVDDLRAKAAWGPDRMNWGMPLSSAVEFVQFLLDVQIQYERFQPGRARCGYPQQVVAVSPEGTQWIENPFPR
jgi:hypothetical protein